MKLYIAIWHHRHGHDLLPLWCADDYQPTVEDAEGLIDPDEYEPKDGEWVELDGPMDVAEKPMFVDQKAATDPWTLFTKRTDDPKLAWLERQLDVVGIEHRRNGSSVHAPILEVRRSRLDDAWALLDPVDDVPDDASRFLTDDDPEGGAAC